MVVGCEIRYDDAHACSQLVARTYDDRMYFLHPIISVVLDMGKGTKEGA